MDGDLLLVMEWVSNNDLRYITVTGTTSIPFFGCLEKTMDSGDIDNSLQSFESPQPRFHPPEQTHSQLTIQPKCPASAEDPAMISLTNSGYS